ncbi:Uu.00g032440.m01.CDS01 [Anthostomella pinea]|uniref:Uu.00g032440.m01.CDS01 n=1 Tax=Anthostomella pinea TaxID=933095 RepID=A0AAI8V8P2_9PEZI|nr:Uu.00g032440.m01.CDS01 [Anthostomella pinea]
MRICFELLDMLKALKKGIRRAANNTLGFNAKTIGPQGVLATLLNNLRDQERVHPQLVALTGCHGRQEPAPLLKKDPADFATRGPILVATTRTNWIGETWKDYFTANLFVPDYKTMAEAINLSSVVFPASLTSGGTGRSIRSPPRLIVLLLKRDPLSFVGRFENAERRPDMIGLLEWMLLLLVDGNVSLAPRQENIKRHCRSLHREDERYACQECDKTFSPSDNLPQRARDNANGAIVMNLITSMAGLKAAPFGDANQHNSSSDGGSTETDEDVDKDFFPDLFVDKRKLDPAFHREIEPEKFRSPASKSGGVFVQEARAQVKQVARCRSVDRWWIYYVYDFFLKSKFRSIFKAIGVVNTVKHAAARSLIPTYSLSMSAPEKPTYLPAELCMVCEGQNASAKLDPSQYFGTPLFYGRDIQEYKKFAMAWYGMLRQDLEILAPKTQKMINSAVREQMNAAGPIVDDGNPSSLCVVIAFHQTTDLFPVDEAYSMMEGDASHVAKVLDWVATFKEKDDADEYLNGADIRAAAALAIASLCSAFENTEKGLRSFYGMAGSKKVRSIPKPLSNVRGGDRSAASEQKKKRAAEDRTFRYTKSFPYGDMDLANGNQSSHGTLAGSRSCKKAAAESIPVNYEASFRLCAITRRQMVEDISASVYDVNFCCEELDSLPDFTPQETRTLQIRDIVWDAKGLYRVKEDLGIMNAPVATYFRAVHSRQGVSDKKDGDVGVSRVPVDTLGYGSSVHFTGEKVEEMTELLREHCSSDELYMETSST